MQPRRILVAVALSTGLGTAPSFAPGFAPSFAQGNPNADQILRSLTPNPPSVTRGIRPVAPPSEPAAVAAPPAGVAPPQVAIRPATPAAPPVAAADTPSVNLTVQFGNNSAELTPATTRTLDELGRALSNPALSGYRFRIEGHTDTVGAPDANKVLSDRRAKAVAEYLASRFNIDRSRLVAVGMGQDGLLVQTPPQTAEPRNRRVQVVNLGT